MSVSMLSEQLAKSGISTEVYTTTANGKTELDVLPGVPTEIDGVKVTYFKRVTKDHSHFSPALLKKLWLEVKNFDAVHIHAWWNLVSIFSCLIALSRRVSVIISPRGTLSPYSFQNKNIGPKWLIHHLLGKYLLNRCTLHVTSEREKEAVMSLLHAKKIITLPNFVKLPPKKAWPPRKGSEALRLLFFSRIEQKKGLDILFSALPAVTIPYILSIAGDGDKNYTEHLKTVARQNLIENKINWLGFQNENKFDVLYGHDLFILPSYDENFGNAIIESLCVGTPVLISEQVGLAGYVKKNGLGWVCKTTPESVSDTINNIAEKEMSVIGDIRDRGPNIIYNDFEEGVLVAKYIDLYNKTIIK